MNSVLKPIEDLLEIDPAWARISTSNDDTELFTALLEVTSTSRVTLVGPNTDPAVEIDIEVIDAVEVPKTDLPVYEEAVIAENKAAHEVIVLADPKMESLGL